MNATALLTLDLEMPDGSPDDPAVRDALEALAVDVRHRLLDGAPHVRVADVAAVIVEGDVHQLVKGLAAAARAHE